MKKLLLLLLASLAGASFGRADTTRADLVARVESCEAILQDFQARSRTAIPAMPIPHSSARLASPRATAAPTVPPPRSPIVSRSPCQPVCSAMG